MLAKILALALVTMLAACSAVPNATSQQPAAPYIGPQIAPLDLVCKSQAPGHPDLVFRIVRADDGAAIVASMNDQPLADYETHTYMNAYMWTNGKERFTVDRMTGVLTMKPDRGPYDCERKGGQRF
ncbi:hypothetical protein [Piscinibacter terrae]|nr:hypothetical protein [Albitalea terrae]